MPNNEIITCLEQKVILLTKVLNLTKQIQVRSRQKDIELDDLYEQRVPFMKRVHKCDDLISSLTKQLPPEQQKRMACILNVEITEKDCNKEEILALTLSKKSIALLQKTVSLDKCAYEAIKIQYDSVREKLNQLRKEGKTPNIFYSRH